MKGSTRFSLLFAGLLIFCQTTPADPITFTFTNINVPGNVLSINNAGQMVGTDGRSGFLYSNGVLTNIDVPGATATYPSKINNLGQIVGTYLDSNNHLNLFLDTNGVFTTINVPGNLDFAKVVVPDYRVGLNDLGQIVGVTSLPLPYGVTAFLYSNGQFSFIPARGGGGLNSSAAFDINNVGQIALEEGSFADSFHSSYVYFNGTYTQIDSFENGNPNAINNTGHVVGFDIGESFSAPNITYFYADGQITAFARSLDFPNPPFYQIYGLNDADQLVGVGPGGNVLATPVPEPGSLLLIAGGLAVVSFLLRRKYARLAAHCSAPLLSLRGGKKQLCLVLSLLGAALSLKADILYRVTDLGTLPGFTTSYGAGINNLGQVVGYAETDFPSHSDHAFLYSNGRMTDLGTLPGFTTLCCSYGAGINDSGQVVGTSIMTPTGVEHAFLYSNGQITDLGTLPGFTTSYGAGINNLGQVVGNSMNNNYVQHVFLYSNGQMRDLGAFLGGNFSEGLAINNAGQVTGWASLSSGFTQAFLYSNGQMMDLGTLPSYTDSQGAAINDLGQIVGTASYPEFGSTAFLYSNGQMRDLNDLIGPAGTGHLLEYAAGINNDGQIVAGGRGHTYLLDPLFTPVPEPSTLALFGVALLGLAAWIRCHLNLFHGVAEPPTR